MNRKQVSLLLVGILVLALIATAVIIILNQPTHRTLIVPDGYAQISWALGNATAGDTVYVKSGTYNERGFVIDKPLSLIGEDASNTTLVGGFDGIRGGGTTLSIIANNVSVSGFTIRSYNFSSLAWYFFGIYPGGNNTKISGNIIEDCAVGIWNEGFFANVTSVMISDNIIRNNLYGGVSILGGPSFVTIENNNFTNDSVGISIANGYRCAIIGNRLSLNKEGGIGLSGARNDIFGNDLSNNNGSSIGFFGSSDLCRVLNNTIEDTDVGIDLSTGSRFSVGGNTISRCTVYAVGFYQTETSNVFTNNITNNAVGVWFSQKADATPMNDTSFYRNNFIDNGQQVFVGASGTINNFDDGKGGNYWSDYTSRYPNATEVGNSGIWNIPYMVAPNNVDKYPLVEPNSAIYSIL